MADRRYVIWFCARGTRVEWARTRTRVGAAFKVWLDSGYAAHGLAHFEVSRTGR